MVFSISIWQWIIEVSYTCVLIIFYSFFYEMSRFVDLLINLLNVFVTFILQPGFYLAGDSHFRGLIASKGVIRAIAITLTDGIIRRNEVAPSNCKSFFLICLNITIHFLFFQNHSIWEESHCGTIGKFWNESLNLLDNALNSQCHS